MPTPKRWLIALPDTPTSGPERPAPLAWSIGVVAGLAAFAVARTLVIPAAFDTATNIAVGVALLGVGLRCGLGVQGLGLERRTLGRGARFGFAVWAVFAGGLGIVAVLPLTRSFFDDQRSDVSVGALLLTVFIVIPLGTAFLEEIAFRGLLLGLFRERTSVWRAALLSSVLFGLWHIPPTLGTAGDNATLERATGDPLAFAGLILGTVAAMTVAGLIFCWLRIRSESLLAPFILHAGVNSTAFFLAWLVVRG